MTTFSKGQSAVWQGPDFDFPITFEDSFKGSDGKMYANVINHLGSKSIVPLDQVTAGSGPVDPENISKSADPTSARNTKKAQASPLEGLSRSSFSDQLRGMGIYVLDVETTGLQNKDKMFSSGRVKIDMDGNVLDPSKAIETHYDVGSGGSIDKRHFKTEEEYQEALEKNLARAHSSKEFGETQRQRGSLAGNARARIEGKLTTPGKFLGDFEQEIAQNSTGSIVWGHNNQFENKQFSTDKIDGTEYSDAHNRMASRNIVQGKGLFGESKKVSNKNKDPSMKGLAQRVTDVLYNDVNESILSQDPSRLRASLGKYAAANVEVINQLQEQIESVRLKSGQYTNLDSQHLSRALMSFGALNGQFDPRNLMLGNKIDTLSRAWLGGYEETHQALDDAKIQGILSQKMVAEIDKFRADPSYKSPLVEQLNDYITTNRGELADKMFKSSILREIIDIEHKGDAQGIQDAEQWIQKATRNYSVVPEGARDRHSYGQQVSVAMDKAFKDDKASIDNIKSSMEKFLAENKIEDASRGMYGPEPARSDKSIMKKALDGRVKIMAAVGGLGAANLLLGGGEKGEDKGYNTYDELYNSQYYGTGFADWQERNNSHKVLY